MPQQVLTACKRVVVKIGSSLVASPNGGLRLDRIGRLAEEFGFTPEAVVTRLREWLS